MRKAVVAGQFYPAVKEKLEKDIRKYVKQGSEKNNAVKAAIVPHAGYLFSGRCAGKVYSSLPWAETYVILGVNHRAIGEDIAISLEDFETPLGVVENDVQLGEEILRQLQIHDSEEAHEYEHSIEVQIPFLQITQERFHIVPILLKNYNFEICQKLAKIIVDASFKLRRKVIIIASSDFTHTGPAYDFSGDIKADKEAIDKILAFETAGFLSLAEKTTICGAGAIATAIEASKLMFAKKAELLMYYDSSEIINNENKVGYAGIVLKMEI